MDSSVLDALEAAVLEDSQTGIDLMQQCPAEHPRWWAILGNGFRIVGRYDDAVRAFERALALDPDPFDRADVLRKRAFLHMDMGRHELAIRDAGLAVEAHRPDGLSGPSDRGLPAALLTRGIALAFAQDCGHTLGDPDQARLDFTAALDASDPIEAPLTHIHASTSLAALAVRSGRGLVHAQMTLYDLARRYRELGFPETAPNVARLRWARTVCDWTLLGGSYETGRRFLLRIERALKTVRRDLREAGAEYDALLVALDEGLLYLENRAPTRLGNHRRRHREDSRERTVAAPRWDDLRKLTLDAYGYLAGLDWGRVLR